MHDSTPPPAPVPAPRRRRPLVLALLLLALAAAGIGGWQWRQYAQQQRLQLRDAGMQRIEALEARMDSLRNDQRAQTARLQQFESTNRVLRDELLGYGQRAALIESHIETLSAPRDDGVDALRLDEVELLLAQARQRLLLAGDLDGTRRAYALAAQLLEALDDPAWFNLRQVLAQERAALDALGDDPRAVAAGRLEAFSAGLPALPLQAPADADPQASWWRRALANLVEVRSSDSAVALEPADRAAGLAALRLELTLAHAAIERRDEDACRDALARADAWLLRLWPESEDRRRLRGMLDALRNQPLRADLPTFGSTLEQLRQRRSH